MKTTMILIAALLATGCAATPSPYGTAANYCDNGDAAYDEQSCLNYWTALNKSVLGSYRDSPRKQEAIAP